MHSELMFSMDASSSAPGIVGAWVVPQAARYSARWVDRGDRTYLTLLVRSTVAEAMVELVCAMHPSVRCLKRDPVSAV
jgi:hypothetical protein